MSITKSEELAGMSKVSHAVSITLQEMRNFAKPGINTRELDEFGASILKKFGARSAPNLAYGFPGATCISVNHEIAHGIPGIHKVLHEGDLVNIDVSAELDGYWSDNGGSFVLGNDLQNLNPLVNASRDILRLAISSIKGGVKISDIGFLINREAKKRGFTVIKNLAGHGIGRSLHESPENIVNYKETFNRERFRKNSVVAIETFISTRSTMAVTLDDGWTLVGDKGGFVTQHEHTIVITDGTPLILTAGNGIW